MTPVKDRVTSGNRTQPQTERSYETPITAHVVQGSMRIMTTVQSELVYDTVFVLGDDEDETDAILGDPETMELLRDAEEEYRTGDVIDGDSLRR